MIVITLTWPSTSVCPPLARAIVTANYIERQYRRKAA